MMMKQQSLQTLLLLMATMLWKYRQTVSEWLKSNLLTMVMTDHLQTMMVIPCLTQYNETTTTTGAVVVVVDNHRESPVKLKMHETIEMLLCAASGT